MSRVPGIQWQEFFSSTSHWLFPLISSLIITWHVRLLSLDFHLISSIDLLIFPLSRNPPNAPHLQVRDVVHRDLVGERHRANLHPGTAVSTRHALPVPRFPSPGHEFLSAHLFLDVLDVRNRRWKSDSALNSCLPRHPKPGASAVPFTITSITHHSYYSPLASIKRTIFNHLPLSTTSHHQTLIWLLVIWS